MEGIILLGLRRYVCEVFGEPVWRRVQSRTGLTDRIYLPLQRYPDHEIHELVGAVSKEIGLGSGSLLEDFGQHLMPEMIRMYSPLIDSDWNLIDMISNTNILFQRLSKVKKSTAGLNDIFDGSRLSNSEGMLLYSGPKDLCFLVKGMLRGFALYRNEIAAISELKCMGLGGTQCEMRVRSVARMSTGRPSSRSGMMAALSNIPQEEPRNNLMGLLKAGS